MNPLQHTLRLSALYDRLACDYEDRLERFEKLVWSSQFPSGIILPFSEPKYDPIVGEFLEHEYKSLKAQYLRLCAIERAMDDLTPLLELI